MTARKASRDAPQATESDGNASGGNISLAAPNAPQANVQSLLVALPLPPKECHQNRSGRRGGLRDEMRAKAEARTYAKYEAKLAIARAFGHDLTISYGDIGPAISTRVYAGEPPRWSRCRVSLAFRFPDRRRRDIFNYAGACKPYLDGLVDAGVMQDDSGIEWGEIGRCIDRENPGVEITVTPITEGE